MTPETNPPSYNPGIPTPSQYLANSQIGFLDNFQSLYNDFLVNHMSLDAASNAGNHTIVEMLNLGDDAGTDLTDMSVYCKNVADQTAQVFMRLASNGTVFQYTNYQLFPLEQTATLQQFFTTLPGGIIAYFGVIDVTSNNLILNLVPNIAKNIITINCWPVGAVASLSFSANLIKNDASGTYSAIDLNRSFAGTGFNNAKQLGYIILANT